MRKIWILLMLCCAIVACKKTEVDFSYSPSEPRAGKAVQFSNLSSSGEDWEWQFGDGVTSTLKSPSHTYKKPGTYRVVLKVDKKNALTATKEITIYDTIPTFVANDSVFYIYRDYTFTANLYNPYNYEVTYLWDLPDMLAGESCPYAIPVINEDDSEEAMTSNSLTLYFTRPMEAARMGLYVVLNGDTTYIEKTFLVKDRPTKSLLMRTDQEGDFRQRIFGDRAEERKADASATLILDAEQDTAQIYNGRLFTLSDMRELNEDMEGFHIAHRKIYFRVGDTHMDERGLWVANIDGSNIVRIDSASCPAMTLDTEDNRIYWVSEDYVKYMPFIGSDNNQFVTIPQWINSDGASCVKLAVDYNFE